MACPKCGKPLGEAVRMGAILHVCAEPEVVEVPKPIRRRTPKPEPVTEEDKPEE